MVVSGTLSPTVGGWASNLIANYGVWLWFCGDLEFTEGPMKVKPNKNATKNQHHACFTNDQPAQICFEKKLIHHYDDQVEKGKARLWLFFEG